MCVGSSKNLIPMTKFTSATWLQNVYLQKFPKLSWWSCHKIFSRPITLGFEFSLMRYNCKKFRLWVVSNSVTRRTTAKYTHARTHARLGVHTTRNATRGERWRLKRTGTSSQFTVRRSFERLRKVRTPRKYLDISRCRLGEIYRWVV